MTSDIQYLFINAAPINSWTDDISTYASLFVATLALFTSLWQGHTSRKHNILMVKPLLEGHSSHDKNNSTYSLEIRNDGLGPAIITAARIYRDGKLVEGEGPTIIDQAMTGVEGCELINREFFWTRFIVPAGKKIDLLLVKHDRKIQDMDAYLGRILDLEIDYEDAYGNKCETYRTRKPTEL